MTREELNAKNKADLLALATGANLAATPAMTKGDLVELLLANAQLAAATAPAAPTPAPVTTEAAAPANDQAAQIEQLQKQMAQLMALNQAQAADLNAAREQAAKAAAALETDKLVPDNGVDLPKEGALRSLDGALAGARKMRVTVMATESEKEDVKLGVNGHLVIIKRGLPVVIDEAYVEVLRNSTIDTIAQDPETGQKVAVKMQRYPFTAEPA
jgi:hypothetical protein